MIYKRTSTQTRPSGTSFEAQHAALRPLRAGRRADRIALEPRHLFDGAVGVVAPELMADVGHADAAVFAAERAVATLPRDSAPAPAAPQSAPTERQLLVVDNSVANWQALVNGAAPNTDVLLLDSSRDGLSQIAEHLVSGTQYSAIHIMSHGSDGALELGNRAVTTANLTQYQVQLDAIGHSLSPGGDLLLYGCDIGAGQYGADFLSALAQATHADVAASTDLTGAAARGGNWTLEAHTGAIQATLPITAAARDGYADLLYVGSVQTIVQTSEPATTPASGDPLAPQLAEHVPVAIGEVVRMRIVVNVAEVTDTNGQIRVALPDGAQFLNDGSASIALVSDAGGLTATGIVGPGEALADGTVDTAASTAIDIRGLRPSFALANAGANNAIANDSTTPIGAPGPAQASFASGDDVRFVLGDVSNTNADLDSEYVVIEYNLVVNNQLSNQAAVNGVASATALPISFVYEGSGLVRFTSEVDTLDVTEPVVGNVDTHVVSVSGNVVTFQTSFTNTGDATLNNVKIFDDFNGATNLSFGAVVGSSSGFSDQSSAGALDVRVPSVAAGASVAVTYTATLIDPLSPADNPRAVVTGTSLSLAGANLVVRDGESGTGAVLPGLPVSNSIDQRTGADGVGADTTVLNNYQGVAGAGLSTVSGTLWDDTLNQDQVIAANEHGLGGVTVNLIWAGPDNVFGNGDDQTFTTVTSSAAGNQGSYSFGAVPSGDVRITVPTALTDAQSGPVRVYFDRIAATPQDDGLIALSLPAGAGSAYTEADFGYIKQNAAPTITSAAALTLVRDDSTGFVGANRITIADPDLLEGFNPTPLPANYEARLNVGQGVLTVPAVAGVTVTGNGSNALTLTGSVADINTALAALTYRPNPNFIGADTLTVQINDRGNVGDANNNGVAGEAADNLSATTSTALTVAAAAPALPPIVVAPPPTANLIDRNQTLPVLALSPVNAASNFIAPYIPAPNQNADFDPFQPATSSTVFSPIVASADTKTATEISTQKVVPANVKGAKIVNDDCVDDVKTKPKAKPIKRSSVTQALSDKVKPFSEQINAVKRAFKPPAKLAPRSSPSTKC